MYTIPRGVYNDYGHFIARPSYVLEFEDGTVWNSDGFISVKEVEEYVLPLLDFYYKDIIHIEARNKFIK